MLHNLTRGSLVLLLILLSLSTLFAQQKTVTGVVHNAESQEPLHGVTIGIKGTSKTILTNEKGEFSISVPSNETVLKFSYVGFGYVEFAVGNKTSFPVSLTKETKQLEDVIVLGYGSQKRANVLGSVATIQPKDVEDLPVANLSTALKNLVPGVSVSQSAGKPGAATTLNIRGASSFASGGNTTPLFVIDGIVESYTSGGSVDATGKTTFDNLDPTLIESITFLKDAAATIYGARGANGVVLVTTKRGKAGKPKLSYSGSYSTEDAAKRPQMLSAFDHATLLNNWVQNAKPFNVIPADIYSAAELDSLKTKDYNWFDQTWTPAHIQRHTLNISGGSDKLTFFAGGNYYDEIGNLRDLYAKKYGFRLGMNAKVVNGLSVDIVIGTDNSTLNRPSPKGTTTSEQSNELNATVGGLLRVPRWVPMYYNGSPFNYAALGWHPYELQNSGSYAKSNTQGLSINATLEYKIPVIKGLTARVQYGRNTRNNFGKEYYVPYNLTDFVQTGTHTNTGASATKATGTQNVLYTNTVASIVRKANGNSLMETYDGSKSYQLTESINYATAFGQHDLSVSLIAEQSQTNGDFFRSSKEIQVIPGVDQFFGYSSDILSNNITITGQSSSLGRVSYAGRLNYGFKDKYLLEAAFRQDASPNFPTDKQWGFFPSVAIGWKVSEENFFKEKVDFINDLKLRFNVGLTGNDAVTSFGYITRFTSAPNGMLFGTSLSNGLNNSNIPNSEITWEKALFKDLGIDGTFWNRRFNFNIDYYYKHQYDMLETPNSVVPNTFGGAISDQNHGILNSWGVEAGIGYTGHVGNDFTFFANLNFGKSNNKVIQKYYNINSDTGWKNPINTRTDKGIEGYRATGIVRTQADVDSWYKDHPGWKINGDSLRPGYLNFEDINGDGVITDVDQTRLTNRSNSTFGAGFNLGVGWKGFKLSANISLSVGGNTTWRKADIAVPTKDVNGLTMWNDSYTRANPNATLPAIYAPYVTEQSSFWIKNATTMRVNNMQLSYAAPAQFTTSHKLPGIRVYATGINLWSLINPTPYKDPAGNAVADYPILRTWTFGLGLSL